MNARTDEGALGPGEGAGGAGTIARVLTEIALNREFDYAIPAELREKVRVGSVVRIPFGRRMVRGFVTALAETSAYAAAKGLALKPLAGLESDAPLFDERMVRLTRWIAAYYAAPFERALAAAIPAPVRREGAGFEKRIMVRANPDVPAAGLAAAVEALQKRAPRQAAVLRQLLAETAASDHGEGGDRGKTADAQPNSLDLPAGVARGETEPSRWLEATALLRETGATMAALRTLAGRGLLLLDQGIRWRGVDASKVVRTEPKSLEADQQRALAAIGEEMDKPKPGVVLLHGVTGSGKTEVYLQAIARALERGQGAIALVPEIALTPQTMERFIGRFGETVAVLHSHLSDGERYDEWQRIASGRARVVVGARSALFAPVKDLGLLVVDEEHEPAYKQDEAPRYNARDVAVMRGSMEGCCVLLGSATPSLESYRNAQTGRYRLVAMPRRVDGCLLPCVHVVDMRAEQEKNQALRVFSAELEEAVRSRLDRAEQTILFLNRRGFATNVMCPVCGHVEECPDCAVKMTYHRTTGMLVCHVCGRMRPAPARCTNPDCGALTIKMKGLGTQKVELMARKLFPGARIQRMDADTTAAKHAHEDILGRFRRGDIDILIGTQMIAKGLDFPNVTLVGVIGADTSLQLPDFRAAERTFQLLTQVAGRAGRGDTPGDVFFQTFNPVHYAITAARHNDYATFYDQEVEFRRQLGYPPFARLTLLTLSGPDEKRLNELAAALAQRLRATPHPEALEIDGPAPAPLAKAKTKYRIHITLRGPSPRDIPILLRQVLPTFRLPKADSLSINVDALSMI